MKMVGSGDMVDLAGRSIHGSYLYVVDKDVHRD
jgi:hypothetical protein